MQPARMSIRSASLQLVQLDSNTADISAWVAFPESSHDSVRVEDVLNCFDGVTLGQAWLLDDNGRAVFIGASGLSSVSFSATSVNRLKGRSGEVHSMLTEKECIAQPLHKLRQRVSSRASYSKTNPRNPRTFERLLPWDEFFPGARRRFDELDDTIRRFKRKVVYNQVILDDGTEAFGRTAACEDDVKSVLIEHVLQCVTEVAKARGIDFEYTGSGSGRHLSNTDLVLRKCGVTVSTQLSKLIVGIVELKANWQLKLGPEDDLIEALHNPDKTEWVISIIQQAFGDAVTDEAPIMIITNYDVAYFLLRDTNNVLDKTLKVSPAVPWNCQDPPALACYLHALELTAELWDDGVKSRLSREQVPVTPDAGYSLQSGELTLVLNSGIYKNGVSIQGARHSLAPRRPRQPQQRHHYSQQHLLQQQQQWGLEQQQHQQQWGSEQQQQQQWGLEQQQQQQLAQLSVHSSHGTAESSVPESAAIIGQHAQQTAVCRDGSSIDRGSSDGGSHTSSEHSVAVSSSSSMSGSSRACGDDWQAWADMAEKPGLEAAVAAVDVLPYLSSSELRYTDDGISCSSTSTVVKGCIVDEPAALKLYCTKPETMRLFLTETAAYIRMAHLQGSCIVPVAAIGRLPHSGRCVLGLKLGQPLPRPLPAALANSAKAALAELHQAGYSHDDINSGNLLVFGDKVLMCDLQTCQANPKQHSLDEDIRQLQKVLEGF